VTFFSLDTSTRTGSMAIWRDGVSAGIAGDADISLPGRPPRSHAERQPLEAIAWLASRGLTLRDIDTFVVVAGPGSFTGLRVGIAAVQGWAFAMGRNVAAVPTLDAVVATVDGHVPGTAIIVPCLDALRGEVFYGAWRAGVELVGAAVGRPADAVAAIAAAAQDTPVCVVGDAAQKYVEEWAAAGWTTLTPAMTFAEAAVRIAAAGAVTAGPPHAARPLYVRRTDAELMRERRDSARDGAGT
jgi:tRNA threonylcarbamoyladenosine biosynthesis protein TsaB